MLIDEFAFESEEPGPVTAGQSVAFRDRVLDAGKEDGGVLKVPGRDRGCRLYMRPL
jgi:hypothetical protein